MRPACRYLWLVPWMMVLAVVLKASPAQAQTCAPRPQGMIAWWPGDGTGEDIAGNHPVELQSSGAYDTGLVNQAFKCPYFRVADDPIWTLGTEPFTIDLWVRFDDLTPNYDNGRHTRLPFIAHDQGSGPNPKWTFIYDTLGHRGLSGEFPALRFTIWVPESGGLSLDPVVAPWNPVVGTWYHVAVTRSGSEYRLYINGAWAKTEYDNHTIPDPSYYLTIGMAEWQFMLNGLVDEVEIYDRALTATEIQRIFAAGSAGKCRGSMPVAIDIKPGRFPNSINPRSEGVIPVGILTTPDLDVLDVDAASCQFGPTGTESGPQQWALEDVDSDGDMDLILHFPTPSSGLVCGSTSAMLTGSLVGGQPIQGTDSVRTVGCR